MAPAPAREGLAPAARALGLLAMLLAVALAAPPWTLAQTAASPPSAAPALPTDPAQPCPAPTSLQNAAPAGADAPVTDYAIVIDVSGSMNGDYNPIDGTPDAVDPNGNLITPDRLIFPKVKDAVERFIASLPPDANVAIIPFGSGVDPSRTRVFPLASAGQADAARAYVAGLQARDGFTHITEAVNAAIGQLTALKAADPGRDHYQTVLLYTDGQGNGTDDVVNGAPSVDALLASIAAYKTSQPFLFVKYVGLGVEPPDRAQLEAAGVQVVQEATGQVSPIRELRLAIVGGNLGALRPGDAAASRLCVVAGDLSGKPRLTFALGQGDLPTGVDLQLATQSQFADPVGVPLRWNLAGGAPGDYAAYLEVATDQKDVVLVPARLPVQFTIAAPPTVPPPTVPPPTVPPPTVPPPTAPPTVPPPTVPPPTVPPPTRAVVATWPVPLDFGKQDVNTTSDPKTPVEWRLDLPIQLLNGATAAMRFGPDLTPALDHDSLFQVGATPPRPDLALDGRESSTSAIVRISAGPLQQMGAGDHEINGHLFVDAGDAAFPLPDVRRRGDGTWDVPIVLHANVYTPLPWAKIIGGIVAGLVVLAALWLLWTQRPFLPKTAELNYSGSIRRIGGMRSVVVGGPGDKYLSHASTLGRVQGRWGRNARFVADAAAKNVKVGVRNVPPGKSVNLRKGANPITSDEASVVYRQ